MRARYYDPSVGRFTSEDPAKSQQNWFIYADNNPISGVDATGKISLAEGIGFGFAIAMCIAAVALMKAGNVVAALNAAKAAVRVFAFALSGEGIGGLTHLTGHGRGIVGSLAGIIGIVLAGNVISDMFFKQFIPYIQSAIIDARCGWDTAAAPAVAAAFSYTMLLMGALLAMDYESSKS